MIPGFLNIVLRSAVIYLVVVIGLRLTGKRHLAQMSILDFVLILLISNAVQNAMVGNDNSLLGGIIAAGTLLILNQILSFILYRSGYAEKLFQGTPTLLVHDGNIIKQGLGMEKITAEELERVVREHGIETVSKVKTAIMELDGTISVVGTDHSEHRIETFKHRRMKFQQ